MMRLWPGVRCLLASDLTILAQAADRWPGLSRLRSMQPRDGGLQAVRRALAYLRGYRREAVGAVVALLLVAAANLATPQLIRIAIDVGFTQAQPSALAEAVVGAGPTAPRRVEHDPAGGPIRPAGDPRIRSRELRARALRPRQR